MSFRTLIAALLCLAVAGARGSWALFAQEDQAQSELSQSTPRELRDLMRLGQVTMQFVPAEELPAEEWGRCDFKLSFQREFEFEADSKLRAGQRIAIVKVTSIKCDIQVVHQIRLRQELAPPRTWRSAVTWHEFDHVAIGSDPRPALILAFLAEHLPTIERPILRREEAELTSLAVPWINEDLTKREQALIELIRQNNRLLDATSHHGVDALPDRRAFFAKLYTKEHLAELKFPFLGEALKVFEEKAYRDAEARWLESLPTPP